MNLLSLYLRAAKIASLGVIKNPIAIGGIFAMYIFFGIATVLLSSFGYAGGLIVSFIFLFFLTIGFRICEEIVAGRRKIGIDDFKEVDWTLFNAIVNSGFIIWITSYALQFITSGSNAAWINAGFNVIVVFALNPIPEIAITRRLDGMSALLLAFEFMKRRTLEWILPILVLISPLLIVGGLQYFIMSAAGKDVLFPPSLLLSGLSLYLPMNSILTLLLHAAISATVGLWIMLFRVSLFEDLLRRN